MTYPLEKTPMNELPWFFLILLSKKHWLIRHTFGKTVKTYILNSMLEASVAKLFSSGPRWEEFENALLT